MIRKNLIKFLFYFYISTALITCRDTAKGQQTDSDYNKKLEAYQKQAHRFEVRKCALYYNEKLVVFDTLKNFEKVMGKNSIAQGYGYRIIYPENGLQVYLEDLPNGKEFYVQRLSVLMSHKLKEHGELHPIDSFDLTRKLYQGYILFDSILVDANTKLEDVKRQREERGLRKFKPFLRNNASQTVIYNAANCIPESDCQGDCQILVTLYYHENEVTNELSTIQTFRFEHMKF